MLGGNILVKQETMPLMTVGLVDKIRYGMVFMGIRESHLTSKIWVGIIVIVIQKIAKVH